MVNPSAPIFDRASFTRIACSMAPSDRPRTGAFLAAGFPVTLVEREAAALYRGTGIIRRTIEANAATDNPLVFAQDEAVRLQQPHPERDRDGVLRRGERAPHRTAVASISTSASSSSSDFTSTSAMAG